MQQSLSYINQDLEYGLEVQKTKKLPAKILSYEERIGKYQKHHLTDELISRANKPENATKRTSVIGKTTRSVVAITRQKLCKTRTEWFMSDTYMAKVTECGIRQNRNIIGEINGTKFNITRCRKRKGWVFKPLENELAKRKNISELGNTKNPTNKKDTEDNCRHENNSSKRTRSNARAHESKFPNNSNSSSNKQSAEVETTETKKSKTESAEIKVLVSKKKPLANKRRKTTNSERIIRYQKFKAYDNPKNLSQHYPLSQEDCYELQKRSSKAYNLNAMNEILLDMSRKPELQGNSFVSKAKFMAYMTKAYQEEGRDVDKANSPTFKIMKRRPKAEVTEIITLAAREKYLNEVENSGIHTRCDYTQFRARIAGGFPINLGYDLLRNMIGVTKKDTVFEVNMHKEVALTEHYKHLLLNHTKGVGGYAGVEELELVEV